MKYYTVVSKGYCELPDRVVRLYATSNEAEEKAKIYGIAAATKYIRDHKLFAPNAIYDTEEEDLLKHLFKIMALKKAFKVVEADTDVLTDSDRLLQKGPERNVDSIVAQMKNALKDILD